MLVSVLTPLYNRERSIRNVYNSLCTQTNKDFEWLVVNDGSTDDSNRIMQDIIMHHDGSFPIQYYTKKNEGLNRTFNKGIDLVRGDLIFRLDSDDEALPDAIELIHKKYPLIKNNNRLCALVFRSLLNDGTPNGNHPFEHDCIGNFCTYRYVYGATGDRSEVVKTDIFQRFKFPEIAGENFCSEGVVWSRMSREYNCYYFCDAVYKKGFEDDSITAKVYQTLKRCSKGAALVYYEWMMHKEIPYKARFLHAIRYYRFAFFAKSPLFKGIPIVLSVPALPIGILIILRDFVKYPESFKKSPK